MTEKPDPDDRPASRSEGDRPKSSSTHRIWLFVGGLAVVALRLYVIRRSPFPNVIGDEPAYLSMARELSGRGGWNLGTAQTYGPGYSVLLIPWYLLDLSGSAVYRAAELTNVLLGAGLFVALEALVRRLTYLTRPVTIAVAAIAASLPALAITANYAWSDNLAPLAFTLICLAVVSLVRRPDLGRVLLAGGTTVAAHTVHGRFTPLLFVVLAIVALQVQQRRLRLRDAAIGTAIVAAGFVAIDVGTTHLYNSLYEVDGQIRQTTGTDLSRLTRFRALFHVTAGQLWYLLVTTAGLAGLGILAALRALSSKVREQRSGAQAQSPRQPLLRTQGGALTAVAILVVLEFAISAAFMAARPRSDQLIYGRYNDAFAGILVAIGLGALLISATWKRRLVDAGVVGAIAVMSVVILTAFEPDKLGQEFFVKTTIQGLTPIVEDGPQRLAMATAVGLVLLTLLLGAALSDRWLRPAGRNAIVIGAAGVFALAGLTRGAARISDDAPEDPRAVSYVTTIVPPGEPIAFPSTKDAISTDIAALKPFYTYPFQEPSLNLIRTFGPTAELDHQFALARIDDGGLASSGYRLAWVNPRSEMGLWVAPGPRQDRLDRQHRLLPTSGLMTVSDTNQEIQITEPLRLEANRVSGAVRIERSTTEPWATAGPGSSLPGRIRLAVVLVPLDCACPEIELREDFDAWIPPEREVVALDIDVPTPDLNQERYRVELQLVRENVQRTGEVATAEVRVSR